MDFDISANTPKNYSFTRYLAAKKSVDDRSLNHAVWTTFMQSISKANSDTPLKLLELGSGIGTMIQRTLERGSLDRAYYTAIDAQDENTRHGKQAIHAWAQEHGYQTKLDTHKFFLQKPGENIVLEWVTADIFDFLPQSQQSSWDVIIAHAFLDLIDLPSNLPALFNYLRPGGIFYFTINFDGVTILEPPIDPLLDARIIALYHQTMDARLVKGRLSGDSLSGRHLFSQIPLAGGEILAAGASDWVVFPCDGCYPGDEAFFLHFIIHTIETALADNPELSPGDLVSWGLARHRQIEQGQLIYIAHQLDFCGRKIR